MGEHLSIIAVMALVPLGAWVAMGEGMVLEWLHKLLVKLPPFVAKPFATCSRCMVSVWGIPAALVTFPDLNILLLPVYMLAACGLQYVIDR